MDVTLPQLLAARFPAVAFLPASLAVSDTDMADFIDTSRIYRRLSPDEIVRPRPFVELLTIANPVFSVFVFWSSILLLKMLAVYAVIVWKQMQPSVKVFKYLNFNGYYIL